MSLRLHPKVHIQKLTIGRENAPLLVLDNCIEDPERMVERAVSKSFVDGGRFYPGIRARAPLQYKQFLLEQLSGLLVDYFQLGGMRLSLSMCHYSMVTKPAQQLEWIQRIPHIDTVQSTSLASIHYLFREPHGGTAFYRHRSTGYEVVNEGRRQDYFSTLQKEAADPKFTGGGYINGDTPFFEQVHAEEGLFNRMLIYRSNSLHSGSIGEDFVPDTDPRSGRLSINSFIDAK
ncbi:hypothetical protein GNX18_10525 [Microbulbifer sp. SH-1]|uniref:DUF6445 family protein n=1 Tax=Microbulbifer sp. SH-1 TaxID=2681547 RepID=UPI00140C3763|nr:DUF6445 family protein [Microbulbifer sp. SH-1]QIL90141.1 hypothetical protein GNX18_10525 [Microbulbifer sp. SH-1]